MQGEARGSSTKSDQLQAHCSSCDLFSWCTWRWTHGTVFKLHMAVGSWHRSVALHMVIKEFLKDYREAREVVVAVEDGFVRG